MQLLLQTDNFPPHRPCTQDHTPAEWVPDPWVSAMLSRGSHVKHRVVSSQPLVQPKKSPVGVGPISETSSKFCYFLECNIGVSAPNTSAWQQGSGRNSCLGVLCCCAKQAHSSVVPLYLDHEDLLFIQVSNCQIPKPGSRVQAKMYALVPCAAVHYKPTAVLCRCICTVKIQFSYRC